MIVGTGIDIVQVSRIEKAHKRWGDRFAGRLFTEGELDHVEGKRDIYPSLAARFAAKEAFLKALGTGFARGVSWHDMEVRREEGQRPFFHISGKAKEIMDGCGARRAHLSMSHEREYALAQVILED